jgi:hypothetical protein
MKIFGEDLPEVKQFSLIIRDLHRRFCSLSTVADETEQSSKPHAVEIERSDVDNLTEGVKNLHSTFCVLRNCAYLHLRQMEELTKTQWGVKPKRSHRGCDGNEDLCYWRHAAESDHPRRRTSV